MPRESSDARDDLPKEGRCQVGFGKLEDEEGRSVGWRLAILDPLFRRPAPVIEADCGLLRPVEVVFATLFSCFHKTRLEKIRRDSDTQEKVPLKRAHAGIAGSDRRRDRRAGRLAQHRGGVRVLSEVTFWPGLSIVSVTC